MILGVSVALPSLFSNAPKPIAEQTCVQRPWAFPLIRVLSSQINENKQLKMTGGLHPYYPQTLQLEGYVPLTVGFDYILGVFGVTIALVAAVTWYFSGMSSLRMAMRAMNLFRG